MAIQITPPTITSSFSQLSSISAFQSPPSLSRPSFSSPTTTTIRSLNLQPSRKNPTAFVPKSSSTTEFPAEIVDVLGDINIYTASGDSVVFNQLWNQSESVKPGRVDPSRNHA
ncbi:hypothetical protein LXL04_000447 [Taraxacum kok-saghyz]